MLDNDYYNETLVLETMQPVHKDKDDSNVRMVLGQLTECLLPFVILLLVFQKFVSVE